MLKRIHIKGYKSLSDIEVKLKPLTVLFGPNAVGKSNLLDALQLLSKLGTSRTLKEAFDPSYRGKPLESFTIGEKGIKGLLREERLLFSFEARPALVERGCRGRQSTDTRNASFRQRKRNHREG